MGRVKIIFCTISKVHGCVPQNHIVKLKKPQGQCVQGQIVNFNRGIEESYIEAQKRNS